MRDSNLIKVHCSRFSLGLNPHAVMVAAEENGAPLVAHFAASIVYDHRAAHSNFHPAFATSPEIDAWMGEALGFHGIGIGFEI